MYLQPRGPRSKRGLSLDVITYHINQTGTHWVTTLLLSFLSLSTFSSPPSSLQPPFDPHQENISNVLFLKLGISSPESL